MKPNLPVVAVVLSACISARAALPVITAYPTNLTVALSNDATLYVASPNATGYQWRFNGVDISWGTNASLVITNAQTTNAGYYIAVAKNDTGWTPSQVGYLAVVGTQGIASFSNFGDSDSRALYQAGCISGNPITNGTVELFAGPVLDYLQLAGTTAIIPGTSGYGYYNGGNKTILNVSGGQEMYYRVKITYTAPCYGGSFTQLSTTLKFVAGTNTVPPPSNPTPAATNITFPIAIEWPYPAFFVFDSTNQIKVMGETTSLEINYYTPQGIVQPTQWRKDGRDIPGATNKVLTITNIQPSEAGIYDALVTYGTLIGMSPKYNLSVQTMNGTGLFKNPRRTGSDFVCDFEGAPTRNYAVHSSTNLTDWTPLLTLTNASGTTTMTNTIGSNARRYYRAMLLP